MSTHNSNSQHKTRLLSWQKDGADKAHKRGVSRNQAGPTPSVLSQGGSTGSPQRPQLPLRATPRLPRGKAARVTRLSELLGSQK